MNFSAKLIWTCVAVFSIYLGVVTHWLPRQPNCPDWCHPLPGETIAGIAAGERLISEGSKFWFLENIQDESGRKRLYTHNLNIDGFIQYTLRLAGVTSNIPLAIINAIAFLAGLWFGYLTVLKASKAPLLATLFLFFFATNYYFNLLFAFNLRAWHWLGLFGVLLCTLRLNEGDKRAAFWIFPAAFVAFACSYDFAAEVAAAALVLAALARNMRAAGLIVGAFGLAFALRQVQVIGAIGLHAWALDIYYSSIIKTGFVANIFGKPDMGAIEAWYQANSIYRYPANPGSLSLSEHWGLFRWLFKSYWLPYLGPTAVLSALGFFCYKRPGWMLLVGSSAGIAAGLLFFSPYSMHFAVKHAVPLLLFPISLSLAIAAHSLLALGNIGKSAFAFVVILHCATQILNWRSFDLSADSMPEMRKASHLELDHHIQEKGGGHVGARTAYACAVC